MKKLTELSGYNQLKRIGAEKVLQDMGFQKCVLGGPNEKDKPGYTYMGLNIAKEDIYVDD